MGCDVHPMIFRRHELGWWEEAAIPDHTRNYALFGLLARVRLEELTPVVEPRGFPTDMDVEYDQDKFGDHSFSWFTLAEVRKWLWDNRKTELPERGIAQLREWVEVMEFVARHWRLDGEQVRLVFGFDN